MRRFAGAKMGIKYTDYELMHMVALYHTPYLSKEWIRDQFVQRGLDPREDMRRFAYLACKYRDRWKHLGERNLKFIGQPEVERYFTRSTRKLKIPPWALPIFNDHVKQGMTQKAIAVKYGLSRKAINECINRRSMFDPGPNEYWRGKFNKPIPRG